MFISLVHTLTRDSYLSVIPEYSTHPVYIQVCRYNTGYSDRKTHNAMLIMK